MSEVLITRRGGSGGGLKSTIIVSIETGSTVGIYDSTYTTPIMMANEKSVGQYWLTELDNGRYYLKAVKGNDVSTLAYDISEYGVYRVAMTYYPIQVVDYLMLYDPTIGETGASGGNTNPTITGGYVSTTGSAPDYEATRIKISTTYQNPKAIRTANKINLTGYTYFKARASSAVGLNATSPTSKTYTYTTTSSLISINSTDYLYFCGYFSTSGSGTNYIYHAFLLKNDDVATMAEQIGLANNTTDTILASSSDITALFNTEKGVRWMTLACTGDFMWKAINNSTFMSAYNTSQYKTIVDANEHWAKFLALL